MFSPSTKREIIHFHVKIMQWRQRDQDETKTRQNQDAGANLWLNVLLFLPGHSYFSTPYEFLLLLIYVLYPSD